MADYAVIILTHIVRDKSSLHSAQEVAEKTGLSLPTVSKILKLLVKGGVLSSVRGSQGGYAFAGDISKMNVADVIEAVDGPIAVTDCSGQHGSDCTIENFCPTRTAWRKINRSVRGALAAITLQELIEPSFADFEAIK